MNVTMLYVGSSLLAPLKDAEREINRGYNLNLRIAAHNFGAPLDDDGWREVDHGLSQADVVFVIHVMDGENAARLLTSLETYRTRHAAVIVINCMPELMRRTRLGKLDVSKLSGAFAQNGETRGSKSKRALRLFGTAGSWIGRQARAHSTTSATISAKNDAANGSDNRANNGNGSKHGHGQYLKLVDRLPGILRFVPSVGAMRDVKNYLNIFCYFLQPTPANIRAMVLSALKEYVPDARLAKAEIKIPAPEHMPSVAIYHPDAPQLFETFASYQSWYVTKSPKSKVQSPKSAEAILDPASSIGLLLMRPQVVSKTTKHYDALIRAIEAEGLSVIPALSTLMDNREAVGKFFIDNKFQVPSLKSQVVEKTKDQRPTSKNQTTDNGQLTTDNEITTVHSRVSQIVSLTGFSFVGGPAMNDSEAAAVFLSDLNRPYRSAVSLDMQTIDSWRASQTGLNPVQAGMQIAIPEIDGATEPFIYGGLPERGVEPVPLDDRCLRYARRLKRWNRLQTAPRNELNIALVLFCFPPNKGNIGTAADLDVFPSVWQTLRKLKDDGYDVELPDSAAALREQVIGGNADRFSSTANVAYRMTVDEYRRHCPYVPEIESEWGAAPGRINSFGGELLIQGIQLGRVFIGVQPTFGFEGDPMRLMMARSGAPHHGFMAFYSYLAKILNADAVVHVGTHGAMEFMPGKQVGLSGECWPDRLIDELPNVYLYSVNNPSEGTIAKRRSYAELLSYLTPPMENAGVYRELATLKDLVMSYRQTDKDDERERLFESIEEYSRLSNLPVERAGVNHPS
ncbi:MAG: cobaltochelatase subunit CobN [Blastocatellia bacterium]|nr:cobaltochelatase subunit CobN [Blastocatellia bacterium]